MKLDNLPEMQLSLAEEIEPKERPVGFYLATREEVLWRRPTGDVLAWRYKPLTYGPYVGGVKEARWSAQLFANTLGENVFLLEKKEGPFEKRGYETHEQMENLRYLILEVLALSKYLSPSDVSKHLGISLWSTERLCFDLVCSGHLDSVAVQVDNMMSEELAISERGIGLLRRMKEKRQATEKNAPANNDK